MIRFNDPNLYTRGICSAQFADMTTGDIYFSSNKFQEGNITPSSNSDPLRAGLGNGIATIVESDADIQVNFTQANMDLKTKLAGVGAGVTYNAVAPVCQVVTADSAALKVDVTESVPAAQYGMSKAVCYVQEVGTASAIAADGIAYGIAADGTVSGFTAVSGKQYKVWYFVEKLSAMCGKLTTAMNGKVGLFTAQMAVYSNVNAKTNEGTRWGWLYVHVPLKLQADTAVVTGSQSNYDTTAIVGRAISADELVVSGQCEDCSGSALGWYVLVPDGDADVVTGLVAAIGGVISVPKSGTAQVRPQAVMANGQLVALDPAKCTYAMTGAPSGTTVGQSTGVITAGETTGDADMTVTFRYGDKSFTAQCAVSVTEA
ncbi:MAG: hypothetical protein EGR26_06010 [Clostridiales bacterium]|nr:hypothetical protein [Clostridiales bacterium]